MTCVVTRAVTPGRAGAVTEGTRRLPSNGTAHGRRRPRPGAAAAAAARRGTVKSAQLAWPPRVVRALRAGHPGHGGVTGVTGVTGIGGSARGSRRLD